MGDETPLQEFVQLLEEAHAASAAVDDYDPPEEFDLAEFYRLATEQNDAMRKLVGFVVLESTDILAGLDAMDGLQDREA